MEIQVYPVIQGFIVFCVMIVVLLMMLRLIFNYTDPNPFGRIGRFSYKLKKHTDRFVYPVARLLSRMKLDTRLAPLLAILGFIVAGYFVLQLFANLFFTVDGVVSSLINPSITRLVGYLLYGFLGIYSLLIVIRIVLSWISSTGNKLTRFLMKLTDPILEPFRRIIPPLGMFDISPIVVLILLRFLQAAVQGVLLPPI
ncbi:MAG: YggT family protein [Acidobacteriota bacterium]|nr:YggT family protein [Acidobacteriota bacterium]MDH3528986.1 YggT family protein [Acidobacteriota bacterium]